MPRIRAYDATILILLVGGWILPSMWPGYGVGFGSTAQWNPDHYWNYIWIGETGFFSGGVIVEDTLEEGHGHTWPVGPCIPAYVLSLWVPLSAAAILYYAPSRRFIKALWAAIRIGLVVVAAYTFYIAWRFPWESLFLVAVFVGYSAYLFSVRKRSREQGEMRTTYALAARAPLFYPLWVLALALIQGVVPFVGWALTAAGCVMLARRTDL